MTVIQSQSDGPQPVKRRLHHDDDLNPTYLPDTTTLEYKILRIMESTCLIIGSISIFIMILELGSFHNYKNFSTPIEKLTFSSLDGDETLLLRI